MALKQLLNYQIDQLYANGKPSANDLAGLQGLVNGVVDGSTFQLSSQLALLPAATDKLVASSSAGECLAATAEAWPAASIPIIGSARFNQLSRRASRP